MNGLTINQLDSVIPNSNKKINRISWDTSVKHFYRLGLEGTLPTHIKQNIPSSNISRWKHESSDKYIGNALLETIQKDLETNPC